MWFLVSGGACLGSTPIWFCLVEGSKDLLDAIWHGLLAMCGTIQSHADVVVNLVSLSSSGFILEDAFTFIPKPIDHSLMFLMACRDHCFLIPLVLSCSSVVTHGTWTSCVMSDQHACLSKSLGSW